MFGIAAHGHVNPSLEVIRESVARGHRVTYAIPASFAERVAETGAEPRTYDTVLFRDDLPEDAELIDYVEPFLDEAVQELPQHLTAYEGDEPTLILYDLTAYPAHILAPSVHSFVGNCHGSRHAQGEWRRPDGLGALPANIETHTWVPQLRVLEQADAFITHAGAGSSQEGMACGVPMVAVPQAVDQFRNAGTLQSLGVARELPKKEATAESLRKAVLALVAHPRVAARGAEVKARMAAEGGPERAADLIDAELPAAGPLTGPGHPPRSTPVRA